MERSEGPRSKPGSGTLGVTKLGGLPSTRGEREAGDQLGGLSIAERDQDGKTVQPRPVQLAEGGRQHGVVVRRCRRLKGGRLVPPWLSVLDQRLPSVAVATTLQSSTLGAQKLDFVVEYEHPS